MRDYLLDLYTAYWELHRHYVTYASVIQARDVALDIWKTIESKQASGLIGGEAYKEAQSRATYHRYQRERAILEEQERAVAFEVEDAVAEIQSAYLTMRSSTERVNASQQRLESSEALFDAGKLQLEFLIDATEEIVQAESQLAVDQSRYSLSLVSLSRTTGTLLDDVGLMTSDCSCN